jgi:hypothetical protein
MKKRTTGNESNSNRRQRQAKTKFHQKATLILQTGKHPPKDKDRPAQQSEIPNPPYTPSWSRCQKENRETLDMKTARARKRTPPSKEKNKDRKRQTKKNKKKKTKNKTKPMSVVKLAKK